MCSTNGRIQKDSLNKYLVRLDMTKALNYAVNYAIITKPQIFVLNKVSLRDQLSCHVD